MQRVLFIALIFIEFTAHAQQTEMDILHPDLRVVEIYTFNAVNDLRLEKKLAPFEWDDVLYRAARDHAKYLIKEDRLKHEQTMKEKTSPAKRVIIHGGINYTLIGENLVSVRLGVVLDVKGRKLSTQSYHSTARTMAQLWKASPKHYRNIVNEKFNVTSLAVAYDSISQRLVAVQVFGFTPNQVNPSDHPDYSDALLALPERKLPFGLKESTDFNPKDSKAIRLFLRLSSLNGTLIGSYKTGKKAFRGRRSGIALEYIPLSQFDSGSVDYHLTRNRRNGLFALNGELQKPVYRREMLKYSRQQSPREVFLNLWVFKIYKRNKAFLYPTGAEAGTNLILIRKKKLITHVTPLTVPAELLEEPMPALQFQNSFSEHLSKQQFKQVSKYDTLAIKVFYPLAITSIDTITAQHVIKMMENVNAKIVGINASAYASVDGDMSENHQIAKERVNEFMSLVTPYLDTLNIVPQISSKEQWDLFLTQIASHNLTHLKNLHRRELRKYVNANRNDSLISSLLSEQRFTRFEIVTRHDTLISLPFENAIENYYRQKKKFESLKTKTAAHAAVLEQHQLKAYGEMISLNTADSLAIIKSERYPTFQYHNLMFRYLVRGDLTDEAFYTQLHTLGRSRYLSAAARKQLIYNNLVFIYKKYGNDGPIWKMLDKEKLFCHRYRKSQFLIRHKKTLQCWRDEGFISDSNYYMLKEFPHLMALSRRGNSQHSDSLAKYYTTSMIQELYYPILPKEIFSHVAKVKGLYHPNDNLLSDQERVRLALFYCAFRKFDLAKSLLAPIVDDDQPDPTALKLFMTLQASSFKDQHEYIKYLIGEYPKLGSLEWCGIWTEGEYLSYLLLEDHALRHFYHCNCKSLSGNNN